MISRKKLLVGSILALALLLILTPLPDPLFSEQYVTTLRSSNGTLLSASIAPDQQWRFPPSDSIPVKFKTATRLFEDEYFNYHLGINPVSILRAAWQNSQADKVVSGGSTITMQTIRMAYGNKKRTYFQKFLEMIASTKLELIYSKKSILRMYADHAPFGGNIVGLNAAAWRYFGRSPHQLSWAETATLAILPNSPSNIYPGKNDESLLKKRDFLLDKIHSRGHIDEDELFLAKQEPLPQRIKSLPNRAYHLLHRSIREGMAGQNIVTTLDANLQVRATNIVNRYSEAMADNQINNAAAIISEVKTGNVLAYVGNSNNLGDHGQHVDIITSKRSPGSLLKPILYAAALDDGLITPNQLLPDIPVFYNGFSPKNFDREYRGAVAADEALTSSLNVPFVHLLIDYGYEKFHKKLVDMGLTSFDKPASHYGLSIILGGAETSLWELTNLYSGMARATQNFLDRPLNKGYSPQDYQSNQYLLNKSRKPVKLQDDGHIRIPSIDFTLRAIQEVKRPEEETGWEFFGSSRPISWKTGTSYGFRDGWAIGLNGNYVVGVWIGNADGEGRPGLTGVRTAAPLLFELFDLLGGDENQKEFFGGSYEICQHSGMLASGNCPKKLSLSMPDYMVQGRKCSYHQVIHLDQNEKFRVNSSCYDVAKMKKSARFVLPPVQSWYYSKYHPTYQSLPPYLTNCSETSATPSFELIYPRQFTKIHIPLEQDGKKGRVIFEAAHDDKNSVIHWHLDKQFLGTTKGNHQVAINTTKGLHSITLIDELGNEVFQRFEVLN